MSDEDMAAVAAIRAQRRDRMAHEFLCPACAHRDHQGCDLQCSYCDVRCSCPCRRWAIPLPARQLSA